MHSPGPTDDNSAATRVLALLVAANGQVEDAELDRLDSLLAFERLGVERDAFMQIARRCVADIGAGLRERSWLRTADMLYVDALLDAVVDPEMRLLVCRLCVAVITADGQVTADERLLYGHTLARWRIRPDEVAQVIRHDCVL
jgi:uncharacterized tellurite resistance protein B-like protein